jgi:hypothetical protein
MGKIISIALTVSRVLIEIVNTGGYFSFLLVILYMYIDLFNSSI